MINPEAIALNNILSLFENKYYSKREAADIVGGRKKLESLIEANKIEAIKNNPTQKGQMVLQCGTSFAALQGKKQIG